MDASWRASKYDLFKSIVAIILLVLALTLMWIAPVPSAIPSPTFSPTSTAVRVSPTSPAPSATPSPVPSPAATNVSEPTATPLPIATETPSLEPTHTSPAEEPVVTTCDMAASRSRLMVGTRATILRRLNFRSSPGIRQNWILTNIPGTNVEIVGGPECIPYWTGAYLWWQIRLPDGRVGWSAEGSLGGSYYFIEPAP